MKTVVTPDKHITVDLRTPLIRKFVNAKTPDEKAKILEKHSREINDYQNISFAWPWFNSCPILVTFSLEKDFSNSFTFITYEHKLDKPFCFTPGKKYYWKVSNMFGKVKYQSWFKTKDTPGAFIEIQNCHNIRDLGGWNIEGGGRVKREMIYRSGKLNEWETGEHRSLYEREGYLVIKNRLKLKSEIDLRSGWDDGGQNYNIWDPSMPYLKRSIGCYVEIFPDIVWPGERIHYTHLDTPSRLKDIFEFLANKDNYPVLFHCYCGADRTGTLAFLINGLLGVSTEDLFTDYELTSFSVYDRRWRGDIKNGKFINEEMIKKDSFWVVFGPLPRLMLERYGTGDNKLSSAIENYLMSYCKISKDTIGAIKEILIEK